MNKEIAIGIFGQSIKQNLEGEMRKNSPYIFWPLLCFLYKQETGNFLQLTNQGFLFSQYFQELLISFTEQIKINPFMTEADII